jgi:hypothetical protein
VQAHFLKENVGDSVCVGMIYVDFLSIDRCLMTSI